MVQASTFNGLPSGESSNDREAPAPGGVSGASADMKVFFYQYEVPARLRRFLGQGCVDARLLSERVRRRVLVGDDGLTRFHVRVLPMGWSWSVHLLQ